MRPVVFAASTIVPLYAEPGAAGALYRTHVSHRTKGTIVGDALPNAMQLNHCNLSGTDDIDRRTGDLVWRKTCSLRGFWCRLEVFGEAAMMGEWGLEDLSQQHCALHLIFTRLV